MPNSPFIDPTTIETPGKWEELQMLFTDPGTASIWRLAILLVIGGILAMYLRFLYRFSSPQASGDSISRVFPLLTLVTIAVIAVVKSSLALSLGLVGALSIVRFRAAIKDPEELVYLFLCIGVGLALGAEQVWLAAALVVAASLFVLVIDRLRPTVSAGDAFLTVIGPADTDALAAINETCDRVTLERCEVDGDERQTRVRLHRVLPSSAPAMVTSLQEKLPGCHVSFVSTASLV